MDNEELLLFAAGQKKARFLPFSPTIVKTDGDIVQSGYTFALSAQTSPAWGDLGFYGSSLARINGLSILGQINLSTWEELGIGFSGSGAVSDPATWANGIYATATDGVLNSVMGAQIATGLSLNTDYPFAIISGTAATCLLLKISNTWKLLWIGYSSTTPIYPCLASLDAVGTCKFRLANLPYPFTIDYGIATQRLAGARAPGDTFTHEADCLIGWTVTNLGTSRNSSIGLRQQDDNNRYSIAIAPDGSIILNEKVGGSTTVRGMAAAGSISNGQRMVAIAEGSVIKIFANNVLKITYSSASYFTSLKAGSVISLGNGAIFSDLITWPRFPAGYLQSMLNRYVK